MKKSYFCLSWLAPYHIHSGGGNICLGIQRFHNILDIGERCGGCGDTSDQGWEGRGRGSDRRVDVTMIFWIIWDTVVACYVSFTKKSMNLKKNVFLPLSQFPLLIALFHLHRQELDDSVVPSFLPLPLSFPNPADP